MPGVVKSMSRYARRFDSVDSTSIESKRFLIVPSLSSAARIPFPGATRALAVSSSSGAITVIVSPSGSRLTPSIALPFGRPTLYDPVSEGPRCGGGPSLRPARSGVDTWNREGADFSMEEGAILGVEEAVSRSGAGGDRCGRNRGWTRCGATAATFVGTAKNDVLNGTTKADKLYGRGGNDKLYGKGGNDLLVGGPGADRIACGGGKDTVRADRRDTVAGDCETVTGLTKTSPQPSLPAPPAPPAAPRRRRPPRQWRVVTAVSRTTATGSASRSSHRRRGHKRVVRDQDALHARLDLHRQVLDDRSEERR